MHISIDISCVLWLWSFPRLQSFPLLFPAFISHFTNHTSALLMLGSKNNESPGPLGLSQRMPRLIRDFNNCTLNTILRGNVQVPHSVRSQGVEDRNPDVSSEADLWGLYRSHKSAVSPVSSHEGAHWSPYFNGPCFPLTNTQTCAEWVEQRKTWERCHFQGGCGCRDAGIRLALVGFNRMFVTGLLGDVWSCMGVGGG